MNKSIDISVDASVFVVNLTGDAEQDLEEYTASLEKLDDILDLNGVTVCRNDNAAETLMANYKNVARLCSEVGFDYVGSRDIETLAQGLIARINSLEDHHKISDVSMSKVSFTPNNICTQCLAATAILRSYCEEGNKDHYIMVSNASDSEAKIQAYVSNVISRRRDIAKLPKKPELFKESVPIFTNFYEFIECLNAEDILSRVEDECGIRFALHIAFLHQLKNFEKLEDSAGKHAPVWNSICTPYVGVDFFRYWSRVRKRNEDTMFCRDFLRAVISISSLESLDFEILDTECGKEIPLVSHGEIVPMKFIFDDSIYIHFWRNSKGSIELASIHEREVPVIPDPSRLILRGR